MDINEIFDDPNIDYRMTKEEARHVAAKIRSNIKDPYYGESCSIAANRRRVAQVQRLDAIAAGLTNTLKGWADDFEREQEQALIDVSGNVDPQGKNRSCSYGKRRSETDGLNDDERELLKREDKYNLYLQGKASIPFVKVERGSSAEPLDISSAAGPSNFPDGDY